MKISKRVILLYMAVAVTAVILGIVLFSEEATVDEEYIKGEEFSQLEENLQREQKVTNPNLQSYIDKLIKQDRLSSLTPPFVIDSSRVYKLISNYNQESPEVSNTVGDDKYYPVGVIQADLTALILLVNQKTSVYRDIAVYLVTVKGDSIIDRERVGAFKRNLAEKINTRLTIDSPNIIKARISRRISYPIKQHNTEEFLYRVASNGQIQVNER